MKIVSATGEVTACDAAGQPIYRLAAGERYLMYDDEASHGASGVAVEIVGGFASSIPRYQGEPLDAHRVLLTFIGKLGDAVATASCVSALTLRFPSVTVTVSAPPAARGVFDLFPDVLDTVGYPPRADQLDDYDYLMHFEDIEAVLGGTAISLGEAFSQCLHTPRPASPPAIHLPDDVLGRWRLEDRGMPRVAIHAGPTGSLRTLPADGTERLVSMLVDAGFEVFLVGADATWTGFPSSAASVVDLVNKTPTPADLAVVLMRMQALVTCDSFPMHLAGAMGIATIAMFASTNPALASDYRSVTAVKSSASCSPCGVAEGACPLGQPGCVAMSDPSLDPGCIVDAVLRICQSPVRA